MRACTAAVCTCPCIPVIRSPIIILRNLIYFLFPSYWFPSMTSPKAALEHVLKEDNKGPEPEAFFTKDEDVMAEESMARSLLHHRMGVLFGSRWSAGWVCCFVQDGHFP